MLSELLKQIEPDEAIASVSADGAYDTKACHAAFAARGAMAVIQPRKNAQAWKGEGAAARVRNAAVLACQRLGRAIWKRWSGYHRRSLVETKMHCFKRLGERVMARSFARQVVELHVRVALLNRFTHLGTPLTVAVAFRLGSGELRFTDGLRNKADFRDSLVLACRSEGLRAERR